MIFLFQGVSVNNVDPLDEAQFPGVSKHAEELESWDWIYGRTPPFKIQRHFQKGENKTQPSMLHIELDVTKGKISDITFNNLNCHGVSGQCFVDLKMGLVGAQFKKEELLTTLADVKRSWIEKSLYDAKTFGYLDWLLSCVIESTCLFSSSGDFKSTNLS